MKKNKNDLLVFGALQFMNVLFSLNGVLIKEASVKWEKGGLFRADTLFLLMVAIFLLGVYAILWQKILTKVDLTVAYMCKGMIVFWGMLWAFLFFQERITVCNIIGAVIISVGTYLVTTNE